MKIQNHKNSLEKGQISNINHLHVATGSTIKSIQEEDNDSLVENKGQGVVLFLQQSCGRAQMKRLLKDIKSPREFLKKSNGWNYQWWNIILNHATYFMI